MQVGIVLGSRSQWSTMQHTAELLAKLGVAYEARIITANKNANRLHEYASKAVDRGLEVIIAGSTGAAHLRETLASKTEIPVLGVTIINPVTQKITQVSASYENTGNMVEMKNTGAEGAVNAALFAASLLARKHPHIRNNLTNYRQPNRSAR